MPSPKKKIEVTRNPQPVFPYPPIFDPIPDWWKLPPEKLKQFQKLNLQMKLKEMEIQMKRMKEVQKIL